MSIVSLKKITLIGHLNEKREVLDELQTMGFLHIEPLNLDEYLLDKKELDGTIQAFRHINDSPQKLKPLSNPSFDPKKMQEQILHNKHQMQTLQDEADVVKGKIVDLTPWGNFSLPEPHEIGNQTFWFYIIPHHEMNGLDKGYLIHKDNRFSYVTIMSEKEPEAIVGKQVLLPKESLQSLKNRLDEIEFELEDLQMQRVSLTRFLEAFKENLFQLEDQALLENISKKTYDTHPLFALQGWIPSSEVEKIVNYARKKELVIQIENPKENEQPPTLLENSLSLKGGEDLLTFYMTPSYWLWDPSTTIFFSFAIFFAMIFSDAGYAIILGAILAFFWKRLGKTLPGKRFRNVLLALTLFSLIWGVMVGSYFGVSSDYLKVIDINNYAAMMKLSILVGVIHISIANLAQSWIKRKSLTAIANLGWTATLLGATLAFMSPLKQTGFIFVGIGLIAVVLFTSLEKPFWKRLLNGMMGLTKVTGMFGDVLSYLRLFALGLASASLAAVFNDLAKQVYHSIPGFKLLFALLILLIGHSINFALSLMSGFIHGLRLNYIEFFNWGLPDEGAPFKPFSKKERSTWNH